MSGGYPSSRIQILGKILRQGHGIVKKSTSINVTWEYSFYSRASSAHFELAVPNWEYQNTQVHKVIPKQTKASLFLMA